MTEHTHDAPPPPVRDASSVMVWWALTSGEDCKSVCAKMEEYGTLDFHARGMLELTGNPNGGLRLGTEQAIAGYLAGKLGRVLSSLSRGVLPSDDCWDDFARYAMMARYVRKFGRWP